MRQLSAIPFQTRTLLVAAGLSLSLVGCKKEEVRTFAAPKDSAPAAATPKSVAAAATPAPIQWTTPAGWQEQAAGGMRAASFTVNKDGQTADVSVIPLGGVSGSELDNVNRWRNQLGLEPVDSNQLASSAEKVPVGDVISSLYDLSGTDPKTQQPGRILGAMRADQGTTWFFKMSGPDGLVAQQKPAFMEFLKSIRWGGPAQAVADPVAEAHRGMSTNMKEPGLAHGAAGEKPTWEVPSGWTEQPPTSMRLATFQVKGENGAKADLSVTKLGGTAGGMLLNVNRWRSQLGLEPVDQAGLDPLITQKETAGMKLSFVDLVGRNVESGDPARMLVAIVPRSGTTWFYKLLGPPDLLDQHKAAFIKFVETARYPNAS